MNVLCRFALGLVVIAGLSLYGGVASAAKPHAAPQYYLALGDSVALGYQNPDIPTDRSCKDQSNDASGERGYVCLVWARLKAAHPGMKLANLSLSSTPGEDTCSFLAVTDCLGHKSRAEIPGDTPPYSINKTSQLKAALAFIKTHNVTVISLTLGGNDFLPILRVAETKGVAAAKKLLPGVESRLSANLQKIMGALVTADAGANIILTDQYNPLSGLPPSALGPQGSQILTLAEQELGKLAGGIELLASATGSIYAPVFHQFEGRGPELTWITVGQNIHPNGSGYKLISKVVLASYLDATTDITTSVHAGHNSVKPGQQETFWVTTLPKASVVLTLRYTQGGWHYQASVTGIADLDGVLKAGWTVPNIHGKVAIQACGSYVGKQTVCARTKISVS
jgi:lysophospholipase L1-like esterase